MLLKRTDADKSNCKHQDAGYGKEWKQIDVVKAAAHSVFWRWSVAKWRPLLTVRYKVIYKMETRLHIHS